MQRFANPNMVIRRAGFKDYRLDHGKFPDPKYGAIYPQSGERASVNPLQPRRVGDSDDGLAREVSVAALSLRDRACASGLLELQPLH